MHPNNKFERNGIKKKLLNLQALLEQKNSS